MGPLEHFLYFLQGSLIFLTHSSDSFLYISQLILILQTWNLVCTLDDPIETFLDIFLDKFVPTLVQVEPYLYWDLLILMLMEKNYIEQSFTIIHTTFSHSIKKLCSHLLTILLLWLHSSRILAFHFCSCWLCNMSFLGRSETLCLGSPNMSCWSIGPF